jgi:hypothetical protein
MMIKKITVKKFFPQKVILKFTPFNEAYRRVRARARYKGFSCFVCERKFKDGENIGIVFFLKNPNRVCCFDCGDKIIKNLKEEESDRHKKNS